MRPCLHFLILALLIRAATMTPAASSILRSVKLTVKLQLTLSTMIEIKGPDVVVSSEVSNV
jgi:hypothetical protein